MISTVWLRETDHYTAESLLKKKYVAKHPSSQGPLQCLGPCTLTAKGPESILVGELRATSLAVRNARPASALFVST